MTAKKPAKGGLPTAQALPPEPGTPIVPPGHGSGVQQVSQAFPVQGAVPAGAAQSTNSAASGVGGPPASAKAPSQSGANVSARDVGAPYKRAAPAQRAPAAQPHQSARPAPLPVAAERHSTGALAQAAGAGPIPLRPIPVQMPADGLPRLQAPEDEEQPSPEEQLKQLALTEGPPLLISLVVHMIAVLVLGLIWLPSMASRAIVDLEAVYSEELGEQVEAVPFEVASSDQPEATEQIAALETLPLVDDPNMAPPEVPLQPEGIGAEVLFNAPVVGSPLQGRELGMKKQLLRKYGGSEVTEQAVLEGLKWLARQQQKDGSWSLKGPYADGAYVEREAAATAMALLAFQGAGNTHRRGQFKENVAKGVKALLAFQDAEGNFYNGNGNAALYTQAQCTIALCELYGMTRDSALRDPAEAAVKYCIEAQDSLGGWRYEKARDSDTSVTGWMVMALQSARMASLDVPPQVFKKVEMYLDKAAVDGGSQYKYQPADGEPRLSMTAEGLLCRQYLGWARNDPRLIQGCEILVRNLPSWENRDVYYWYYATQVLHHMEGDYWDKWNEVMRELLPEKQEKQGAERGSWHPTKPTIDAWGPHAGRLYVTCLSLYMLEVYYRHLPIYSPLNKLLRER